jgi:uncharacterized protein YbjT (DUF2867 family)
MILVTGAGGKTGKAVIKALVARGEAVHAFAHRNEQRAPLLALGAKVVSVGSLDDVDAITWAAAGARSVYHICPNVSPHEVRFAQAVIDGVTQAGVRRFVFHSVLHPQIEAMPHHWRKMRVEETLFASALDVTILQPTAYMQNILASWRAIVSEGVFRVPYPVGSRISLVDLDDVAEVAASVLTSDVHVGATYELAGTLALPQTEVAAALSTALGKPVRAEPQTLQAWAARAALGHEARETLMAMFRYYAEHGLIGNPTVLTALLGRAPTTLLEFAKRAAAGLT